MFLINPRCAFLKNRLVNKGTSKKQPLLLKAKFSVSREHCIRTPIFEASVRHYHRTCTQREKQESQAEAENPESTEDGEAKSENTSKLLKELEHTKKVLEETTDALRETKEKLLRSYSERENIIRISKRDVEAAKDFGIRAFVLKFFDVVDTLDICLKNLPAPESISENQAELSAAVSGIIATKKQFLKVMESYSIHQLEAKIGDKFDPNFHDAVFEMQPTESLKTPQSIGAIIKGGWVRGKTLLRPTHVGVIMKSSEVQEES